MEPTGFTIFCDDVREEVNGKISLIGCYGTDLLLPSDAKFPVVLPKLGFHTTFRAPYKGTQPPITLTTYFPGHDDTPMFEADISFPEEMLRAHALMQKDPEWEKRGEATRVSSVRQHFVFSPAPLFEEGYIRVRIMYGETRVQAGALKIVRAANPESTSPANEP